MDSIGYPAEGTMNRIVGQPQVKFWIPIKFWVYRDDNGNGGPDLRQLRTLMDELNQRFNQINNAWIGFYMKCDPTFVNNSAHVTKTFTGATLLMAANNDQGSINVHVIQSFNDPNTAGFAINFLNACMIPAGSYLNPWADGDLAHEVGHILGLSHTHQFSTWDWKCLTECVSRTRTWPTFNLCPTRLISNRVCEATGDGLRDTQADNDLVSNNACFYNVNFGNDEWDDSYDNPPAGLQDRPNVHNIMSYNSATNCVDQFSRLQIAVMLWTLHFQKAADFPGWSNPISTFDDYEPDNAAISARDITLNEIQERNFHQQWNRVGGSGFITQCDVDWVRFVAPCTGNFDILTASMFKKTKANTRLTLFDATLTQIAQNDDISATNLYSNIVQGLTAGQTYFIQIENLSPGTTGYYSLRIVMQGADPASFQISGANVICLTDENYSLSALPSGASVNWSASPQGIVSINPSIGNPTTLSKLINGDITLTATVSNYCGNANFNVVKSVKVGISSITILGPYDPIEHTIMGIACQGEEYYFVASDIETAQSYTWTLFPPPGSNDYPTLHSGSTVYLTFNETGYYTLRISKTNSCGSTFTDMIIGVQECYGLRIAASPNPATDQLNVTVDDESENEKTSGSDKNIKMELFHFNTGVKHKQWSFNNKQKQFTLSLKGISKGVYVLKVIKGNRQQSVKIIVE